MRMLLLALTIANPTLNDDGTPRVDPTVSVSAIRSIECADWIGSGFLIGPHLMVTALHVVKGGTHCTDADTGSEMYVYKTDPRHDLALLTAPALPVNIPYIKISCERFKTGQPYLSWGRTFYGMDSEDNILNRMNTIIATEKYTGKGFTLDDGTPMVHARWFHGAIAPGMSGGPVTDIWGYAHGLNNAGDSEDTIEYEFADGILCKP